MLLAALLVKLTSPGPVLYWSDRVGRYNRIFRMPKFRTMRIDTLLAFCEAQCPINPKTFSLLSFPSVNRW